MRLGLAVALVTSLAPSTTTVGRGQGFVPPGGGQGVTFDLNFNESGPHALPRKVAFNGTSAPPLARCVVASGAWDCEGVTLALTGSGTAPTMNSGAPFVGGGTQAVEFYPTGKYYADSTGLTFEAGMDLYVEAVFKGQTNSSAVVFGQHSSTGNKPGFRFGLSGTTLERITMTMTDTDATTVSAAGTTGHWPDPGLWGMATACVDADEDSTNGGTLTHNGVITGSGANFSALGSIANDGEFAVGHLPSIASTVGLENGEISYVAIYGVVDWMQGGAGGRTECGAVSNQRYQIATGLNADKALGNPFATVTTSSGHAQSMLSADGALHRMTKNWLRVGDRGLLKERSGTNEWLQSADLGTSHTAVDAATGGSVSDPTGATCTTCAVIGSAVDTPHGFTQASAVSLDTSTWAWSTYARAGNQGWAYAVNSTLANVDAYFDLSDCSLGTLGASVVNGYATEYPDGSGWCLIGLAFAGTAAAHTIGIYAAEGDGDNSFTGDAATADIYSWGRQLEDYNHPTSHVETTTAAASRSGTERLEYATARNIDADASLTMLVGAEVVGKSDQSGTDVLNVVQSTPNSSYRWLLSYLSSNRMQIVLNNGAGDSMNTWGVLAGLGGPQTYRVNVKTDASQIFVDGVAGASDSTVDPITDHERLCVAEGYTCVGGGAQGWISRIQFSRYPDLAASGFR